MRVHANDGISAQAKAALQEEGFTVTTDNIPQEQLAAYLNKEQVDVLLVRSATKVRKELLDACPGLKLIGRGGVGLDNIDTVQAKARGIPVVNTPASSSISVAELVMAHLFGLMGLAFGGLGFGILAYLTVLKVFFDEPLAGRPLLLLGALLFLTGVMLVCFGLIGELMVRIWHESQGKPIYAIQERRPRRGEPDAGAR